MFDGFEDPRHQGLRWPVPTDPLGIEGPTRSQASGDEWRRTSRGLYVPTSVDGTRPEQRIVEAAALVPEVAGITGWAGLRWCGGSWFDGRSQPRPRPIVIASGYSDVRDQPGVEVCHERIPNGRIVTYDHVAVTTPVRSTIFEMRRARRLTEAVVVADMAAFDDLASTLEVLAQLHEHKTITGVPLAREAAALMVENSWSPMETRVRLRLVLELGRPTPLCNMPIFDLEGRLLGTPDLFDPRLRLAMEYDSVLHLTTARRSRDIDRETEFRDHGIEVLTIVGSDFDGVGRLTGKLYTALRRAEASLSTRPVLWTLEQPDWWRPTHTVRQRRRLAVLGQEHLLPSRRWAA